uniref:Uncharacterized protein n=1 Tax=Candidatus Kentrum sp. FM TaxID=2126340 RepID=A0A450S3N8_9GAMM|nr:MAG: hypothetical protein BECKFM1743C_GA0114222_100367 [Candidatus Kentron sp. FM]VFJ63473.1 MAG: hypothetical protein BECKFM1743A_GA0114220_103342 [Candidatus Kentron sp. FM]
MPNHALSVQGEASLVDFIGNAPAHLSDQSDTGSPPLVFNNDEYNHQCIIHQCIILDYQVFGDNLMRFFDAEVMPKL